MKSHASSTTAENSHRFQPRRSEQRKLALSEVEVIEGSKDQKSQLTADFNECQPDLRTSLENKQSSFPPNRYNVIMSTHYNIFEDQELFEYLGRAIYESQRLEVNLAYIIRDIRILKGKIQGRNLDECLQEARKVLNTRLEETLGCLISELGSLVSLDRDGENLLREAKDKRNSSVHGFFYKHWIVAIAPTARDAMICELKEAIETISAAFELSKSIQQKLEAQLESDADNLNTTD